MSGVGCSDGGMIICLSALLEIRKQVSVYCSSLFDFVPKVFCWRSASAFTYLNAFYCVYISPQHQFQRCLAATHQSLMKMTLLGVISLEFLLNVGDEVSESCRWFCCFSVTSQTHSRRSL